MKRSLRIKLQQFLINVFYYIIPAGLAIYRHAQGGMTYKRNITGILIVAFIFYKYVQKKNKIMHIKETKEIEDDNRKASTILYFYRQFAIIYVLVFLGLYYVQFNFQTLALTMQLIAGSLVVGALLRIDLANRYGL